MKLVIVAESAVTKNMVRNAFQQTTLEDAHVSIRTPAEGPGKDLDGDTIVLIDWDMDVQTTTRLLDDVKQAGPEVAVILLCPKPGERSAQAALRGRAGSLLRKPFDPEALLQAIQSAQEEPRKRAPSVKVAFMNAFIVAARNVFSTMCGMEIERKHLYVKEDHQMLGDVSGVMGLSGEAVGCVVISLPTSLACQIVARMVGEEPGTELNEDVRDGVGEIINMIAGQAKASLVSTSYHFMISLPSVVCGKGHEISHKKGTPNIVVLFEAAGQTFAIQVCLAPQRDAG